MLARPERETAGSGLLPLLRQSCLPFSALFLLTASLAISRTGRDVVYLQGAGLRNLPLACLGMAVLAPAVAKAMLTAMRRWGPHRVRLALPLATAVVLISAPSWPASGAAMALLFIFIPVIFGVLLSMTWLLAAEKAPEAPGARSRFFSIVGASPMLGSIAGAAAARSLAHFVPPAGFFPVGAILLGIASALTAASGRAVERKRTGGSPGGEVFTSGVSLTKSLPGALIRILIAVAAASSATGVLVEYLFFLNALASHPSPGGSAKYFADLYLWLNAGSLVIQLAALPWLQRKLGLGGSLVLVPVVVFGAASLFAIRVLSCLAVRIVEGGLKSSLYRSSWEQSFTLMTSNVRTAAKVLIDGLASRLGEGIAAAGLMIAGAILPVSWNKPVILAAALACVALLWTISVARLRRMIDRHEDWIRASALNSEAPPPDCCMLTATLGRRTG